MQTINASEARRDFSALVDKVVREEPVMVNRYRDNIMLLSSQHLLDLVNPVSFKAKYMKEADGTITATLEGFDLVVNAKDKNAAKIELASELTEYAEEYLNEFQLYHNATNRKKHFPYVLRVKLAKDLNEVTELIHA
jgi:antitoxin YefM